MSGKRASARGVGARSVQKSQLEKRPRNLRRGKSQKKVQEGERSGVWTTASASVASHVMTATSGPSISATSSCQKEIHQTTNCAHLGAGIADGWQDFVLLDAGEGEKLEQWGPYVLRRPDPQAVWPQGRWQSADAVYQRSHEGGGEWKRNSLPESWLIEYPSQGGTLRFEISLMGFKHTGLFPEQAANWDYMQTCILQVLEKEPERELRILNLFAYTGAATLACAAAGAAEVVHVDASKKINVLAKRNVQHSGLEERYIRFINEDVNRFVDRELRRGRTYDGIVMDPPAYGRGPGGELWKLENAVFPLVDKCTKLLSDRPLFFLLNAYTTGLTAGALTSILQLGPGARFGGSVEGVELLLPARNRPLYLPCGCTGRWTL